MRVTCGFREGAPGGSPASDGGGRDGGGAEVVWVLLEPDGGRPSIGDGGSKGVRLKWFSVR